MQDEEADQAPKEDIITDDLVEDIPDEEALDIEPMAEEDEEV